MSSCLLTRGSSKKGSAKMVKRIGLLIVLMVLLISLAGCQTVQGVGEDIKWTGEKGAELLEGK